MPQVLVTFLCSLDLQSKADIEASAGGAEWGRDLAATLSHPPPSAPPHP